MAMKEHDFPVAVRWVGGRLTRALPRGKSELEVATPPVFPGGIEGVWSPEDLLVAATATCYAVTLVAIAERRAVPLHGLEVSASGRIGTRDDGRAGFVSIDLGVTIETDAGSVEAMERAAESAERNCLVSSSLNVPVRLRADVHAARAAA
jgi:organic hydroperoxide reductase OsmC/OhrA